MITDERREHMEHVLEHGSRITNSELTVLRSQAEFMALWNKLEWRRLADALKELQDRRAKDSEQREELPAKPF